MARGHHDRGADREGQHDGHHHDHAHDHAHGHAPHDHAAHGHAAHAHGSHHHHPVAHDRAFAIGIALNLGFVAIEAWWGWRVDSLALLADAAHNLSDVAGLVLAWGGAFAGRLRPDARYTYGWRRASILAAFFNALLLLVAMGSLAWEAVQRLSTPQAVQGLPIIVVAAIGIVVNGATALLFMRGSAHDLNLRGAFLHMAADALVSLAVVIAGVLALVYGWTRVDPITSLVVAAVIVVFAGLAADSWGRRWTLRRTLHSPLRHRGECACRPPAGQTARPPAPAARPTCPP